MKDTKDSVAYIRVSTDKEEQEQSYKAQQQYFKSIGITKLYCDQGLSGTTINRKGFSQMLYDCGLDIVKVKSGTSYKCCRFNQARCFLCRRKILKYLYL